MALACNLAPVKRGSVSEREPHQYRINKTLNKDTRIMQDNMKKQQKQKQVVANEESKKKERHIVTWTQEVPSFFPLQLVLLFLLLFFYFCLSGLYILLFTYFLLLFYCISSSLGSGVSSLMCVMWAAGGWYTEGADWRPWNWKVFTHPFSLFFCCVAH